MTAGTRRVVVLGGSGFIGSRLVTAFASRGFHVRSASRSASSAGTGALVEPFRCDVTDAASVRAAVAGIPLVVAAFVGGRRTQVEGTRNVCDALSSSGSRLLYLSTAEVYGNASGELDETAPLVSQGWEYSDSKIEAENLCLSAVRSGLYGNLFRPSIVYGPGSATWTLELGNNLTSRQWGSLGRFGEGTCNLIYVDDLVDALCLAAERELPPGDAFNLNGPDHLSWNQFFEAFNSELGLPPLRSWSRAEALFRAGVGHVLRVGKALVARRRSGETSESRTQLALRPSAVTSGPLARLVLALKATPRWESLRGLYPRRVVYLDQKARRVLGYSPTVNARDGIARSAAWFRQMQESAS